MGSHISWVEERTPWLPVPLDEGTVLTHCCHCRVPAAEARFRKLIGHGGYTVTQEVCCASGHGCDANPRKRIGMWMRPVPEYGD